MSFDKIDGTDSYYVIVLVLISDQENIPHAEQQLFKSGLM